MSHQTDYQSIIAGSFDVEDSDGSRPGDVEGVSIPVIISNSEAATLLAAYDETDPNSPSEEISREIARAVLSALLRYSTS
jgi:hypothetical protein